MSTYAGVSGATILDSGVMEISGNPMFAREEAFEYLRRPDGGVTLLNTMTAANGAYRVRARYDLDTQWNSLRATGVGLYNGVTVDIRMERRDKTVQTTVRGDGIALNPHPRATRIVSST